MSSKSTQTDSPSKDGPVVSAPMTWLKTLSDSLERTQCRKDGDAISLEDAFESLMQEWARVRAAGKRVWWIGNGGSLGLCTHLSQDMLNKLTIKSQTLNDPSLITCMANDFGYSNVYAKPLSVLMDEGDLLIAISSSGQSKNILDSVAVAHQKNARVIAVSGFASTNPLFNSNAFLGFYVPSTLYGVTEVGHEALLHAAIESMWMREKAEGGAASGAELKPLGRDS